MIATTAIAIADPRDQSELINFACDLSPIHVKSPEPPRIPWKECSKQITSCFHKGLKIPQEVLRELGSALS